jgi:hypothetical protein
MSVDELYKKYSGAYDSDFEMPETPSDSDDETDDEAGDEESEGMLRPKCIDKILIPCVSPCLVQG